MRNPQSRLAAISARPPLQLVGMRATGGPPQSKGCCRIERNACCVKSSVYCLFGPAPCARGKYRGISGRRHPVANGARSANSQGKQTKRLGRAKLEIATPKKAALCRTQRNIDAGSAEFWWRIPHRFRISAPYHGSVRRRDLRVLTQLAAWYGVQYYSMDRYY